MAAATQLPSLTPPCVCVQDWCFTLESFAAIYADVYPNVPASALGRRLWGDVYFQPASRTFRRKPPEGGGPRTFVQFVLDPLYKLISRTISVGEEELRETLDELGIGMVRAGRSRQGACMRSEGSRAVRSRRPRGCP